MQQKQRVRIRRIIHYISLCLCLSLHRRPGGSASGWRLHIIRIQIYIYICTVYRNISIIWIHIKVVIRVSAWWILPHAQSAWSISISLGREKVLVANLVTLGWLPQRSTKHDEVSTCFNPSPKYRESLEIIILGTSWLKLVPRIYKCINPANNIYSPLSQEGPNGIAMNRSFLPQWNNDNLETFGEWTKHLQNP